MSLIVMTALHEGAHWLAHSPACQNVRGPRDSRISDFRTLTGVIVLLVQILAVTLEKRRFINDLQIARFREIRLFAEPCHRRLGVLLPPFFAPKGRLPRVARASCFGERLSRKAGYARRRADGAERMKNATGHDIGHFACLRSSFAQGSLTVDAVRGSFDKSRSPPTRRGASRYRQPPAVVKS
jgi:hypothetical protein